MDTLKIYLKLVSISTKGRFQYRADFLAGVFSIFLLNLTNLSLIGILLGRFQNLQNWLFWEIVFVYGLWVLSHSLYSMLFWHFQSMEEYVVQGTFDQFLVRPVNILVQFLGREVQYMGFADIFVGLAAIVLAYHNLHLHWGPFLIFFFLLSVVAGTLIEVSIYWILSSITFWKTRFSSGMAIATTMHGIVQKYPLDTFGKGFKILVTGILPLAFTNYYPALVLLGKLKQNPFPNLPFLPYMSSLVAIILLLLGSLVWRFAIRNYSSTGN